jgi:DNA-binding response OmpR family regulator
MHILLIEDDLDLGRALQAALRVEASRASGCAAPAMRPAPWTPRSSTACCWT